MLKFFDPNKLPIFHEYSVYVDILILIYDSNVSLRNASSYKLSRKNDRCCNYEEKVKQEVEMPEESDIK